MNPLNKKVIAGSQTLFRALAVSVLTCMATIGAGAQASPAGGEVTIITDPPGLEVFIDGKSYGPTPVQAVISAGEHTYKITPPAGALPGGGTFTLKDGALIRKTISWPKELAVAGAVGSDRPETPKTQKVEQPPSTAVSPGDKESAGALGPDRPEAPKTQEVEQPPNVPTTPADLVEQLKQALAARDRVIENLAQRVQALEQALTSPQSKPVPVQPVQAVTPTPAASTSYRSAPSEEYEQEERLAQAALDRALIARGGVLLPRGTVEFEPSATYFNSSADVVNIDGFSILPVLVVGDIVSERVHRDIAISAITTRIGLPKDFQIDLRFPYGYELARTVRADGTKTSQRALGIGDAEIALTHQLRRSRGRGTDLLGSIRWKTKIGRDPFRRISTQPALGTGFDSVQGILTFVKPSDPVVFFGGLSYIANFPAKKRVASLDNVKVRVDPGDTIGFNLGAALALNPETSLSFAWQQRFTRSATIGHTVVPGSFLNEGIFQVGGSYVFAPGRSVDVALGIGLTRDIPDFQFAIAFPVRFSLLRGPKAR